MFIFLGSLFRRGAPKLCESESGLVCCDGYSRDQSTGKCISCKPGYFDVNCSQRCFYPTYGVNCQGECSCQKKFCNFSSGCNMGDGGEKHAVFDIDPDCLFGIDHILEDDCSSSGQSDDTCQNF
uniref:Uncharacterized protein n=1 Tax=Magallana gigas TaxID=29159 RepID=A0A8W8JC96_MAGGI